MAELKYTVKVKLSDETEKMLEEAEKRAVKREQMLKSIEQEAEKNEKLSLFALILSLTNAAVYVTWLVYSSIT